MAILNYTTTVPVSRTLAEVQKILAAHGVRRIQTEYSDNGTVAGLTFTLPTDLGAVEFALPVRADEVLTALRAEPGIPPAKRTPEHAARVAWRIAKDWLEAQFALVDARMAAVDEVLLPFVTDNNGRTMYAAWRSNREMIEP